MIKNQYVSGALIFFIIFFLILGNFSSLSQSIKSIPFVLDNSAIFRKIAWVNEDKFAIISERENGMSHIISILDTSGKLIHTSKKIHTGYSCQHEYVLTLKYNIFFFKSTKDEYGIHRFIISNVYKESGILQDSPINVFSIKEVDERKKINMSAYSFKVYKGINGNKAILTYNNNFKYPIHEGFRYKILDQDGAISDEFSFELPYIDSECNIDYAVYDDKSEKIYLICDLFTSNKELERLFKKSFIAIYDLKNKSYNELNEDVPSFFRNKIQFLSDEKKLVFTGFYPDEKMQYLLAVSPI